MHKDLEALGSPTEAQSAVKFARTQLIRGDLDGAERVIRFAVDFNPTSVGLLSVLGDIAARRGQSTVAIIWIQKELPPNREIFRSEISWPACTRTSMILRRPKKHSSRR